VYKKFFLCEGLGIAQYTKNRIGLTNDKTKNRLVRLDAIRQAFGDLQKKIQSLQAAPLPGDLTAAGDALKGPIDNALAKIKLLHDSLDLQGKELTTYVGDESRRNTGPNVWEQGIRWLGLGTEVFDTFDAQIASLESFAGLCKAAKQAYDAFENDTEKLDANNPSAQGRR